ncbi:MAG: Gfo/Idh/MocA family oxidoreductase, partial [Planctomycetaceae bacterium]|nr:Gfo/Idh/MocA family oxidoreductase [Planctomycetaceae bacterium]
MGNRVRAAVIGLGHLGKHHARVLSGLEQAELVAVVDSDEKRAAEYAERFHCEALTDYTKLKGRVDVACVVVPTTKHFEVASWLFSNGIHALVEKPLAYTVKEAETLSKLANQSKLVLQVGHIERFNPALRTIRNHLDTVTFIEAHRLSPYPFRSTDIGVIMDVMIHDLDIILDLVDSPVAEIRANATPVISRGHEDIASARLQFESGAVANITASRISDKVARKMRMFCPAKYINLDFAAKQAWIYKKSPKFDDPNFRVEEMDIAGVDNLMQ